MGRDVTTPVEDQATDDYRVMLAVGTLLGVAAGAAAYRGRPAPIEVDPAYVETDPDTLSEYPDASDKGMSIGSDRCDIEFPVFLAKKGYRALARSSPYRR